MDGPPEALKILALTKEAAEFARQVCPGAVGKIKVRKATAQ